MNPTDIVQQAIWEDGGATCMGRFKFQGAVTSFLIANIASISRAIFDTKAAVPTTALSTDALTVASTVFDTLQTDGRWTEDESGYNFRDTIAGSNFASSTVYRVEYWFTSTGGSLFLAVFKLDAQERWAG